MEKTIDTKFLTSLIKGSRARFSYIRQGQAFYTIDYCPDDEPTELSRVYTYGFHIPLNDIGTGTLHAEEKSILLMRWVRKCIENNELPLINVQTKIN